MQLTLRCRRGRRFCVRWSGRKAPNMAPWTSAPTRAIGARGRRGLRQLRTRPNRRFDDPDRGQDAAAESGASPRPPSPRGDAVVAEADPWASRRRRDRREPAGTTPPARPRPRARSRRSSPPPSRAPSGCARRPRSGSAAGSPRANARRRTGSRAAEEEATDIVKWAQEEADAPARGRPRRRRAGRRDRDQRGADDRRARPGDGRAAARRGRAGEDRRHRRGADDRRERPAGRRGGDSRRATDAAPKKRDEAEARARARCCATPAPPRATSAPRAWRWSRTSASWATRCAPTPSDCCATCRTIHSRHGRPDRPRRRRRRRVRPASSELRSPMSGEGRGVVTPPRAATGTGTCPPPPADGEVLDVPEFIPPGSRHFSVRAACEHMFVCRARTSKERSPSWRLSLAAVKLGRPGAASPVASTVARRPDLRDRRAGSGESNASGVALTRGARRRHRRDSRPAGTADARLRDQRHTARRGRPVRRVLRRARPMLPRCRSTDAPRHARRSIYGCGPPATTSAHVLTLLRITNSKGL